MILFHLFSTLMLFMSFFSPVTILNGNGGGWHPCLVPDLAGKAFNVPPFTVLSVMGLVRIAFVMLWYLHYRPSLLSF